MQPWKTVSKETILQPGKFLTVENHTIELPDGQIISNWPWLITPDYINVVAITEDKQFLCFRQIKYAVGDITLALVGGYLEPGEEPLAAAQRELLEETGYQSSNWTGLGAFAVDGNRGAGTAHLFLARGARHVTKAKADDLEKQQLLHLSQTEIEAALIAGEFKVLSWTTGLALAMLSIK